MRFSTIRSTLVTSTLFLAASLPIIEASTGYQGCYSDAGSLDDQGPFTFQSSGYCKKKCSGKGKPVYALYKGSNCLCGDEIPSSKTSDDDCNVECNGYPADKCMFFQPKGSRACSVTNSACLQVVAIMHMLFIQQATTLKPMALPQLPTGVRVQPVRSRLAVGTPLL